MGAWGVLVTSVLLVISPSWSSIAYIGPSLSILPLCALYSTSSLTKDAADTYVCLLLLLIPSAHQPFSPSLPPFLPRTQTSTTEYLKKLKLLLNKSQAQIQALVASRRVAAAATAASAAAAGGSTAVAPAPVVPVPLALPKTGGVEDTKHYVDVDPNVAQEAYAGGDRGGEGGGRVPHAGTALEMMIQRPPIAPGTVAESGSWAPNKKSADYALMFQNASIAMAVASLDGNFVDCNGAFSIISGYNNREVLQRSVFDLTPAEDCQELMSIVGKMMESPAESAKHFWKRCCFENRDCHCFVSMWLVRKASGEPVYFQCAVLPLEDYPMTNKSVTYDARSQGNALEEGGGRGRGREGVRD